MVGIRTTASQCFRLGCILIRAVVCCCRSCRYLSANMSIAIFWGRAIGHSQHRRNLDCKSIKKTIYFEHPHPKAVIAEEV